MTVQPRPCDIPNSVGCTLRLQLFSGARRYIRAILGARVRGAQRRFIRLWWASEPTPSRRARDAVAVGPSEVKATVGASYRERTGSRKVGCPCHSPTRCPIDLGSSRAHAPSCRACARQDPAFIGPTATQREREGPSISCGLPKRSRFLK